MLPYRVDDEEPNSQRFGRVIPLRPSRQAGGTVIYLDPAGDGRPSREPWTPRDDMAVPRRSRPVAVTPIREPLITSTHVAMLGAFFVVCVSMVVIMVGPRAWSGPGSEGDAARQAQAQLSTPASLQAPAPPQVRLPGTGPLVAEIKAIESNYQVVPGDTLASLARRYGLSVDALAALNNIENRNSLGVGQRLIIP